MEIAARPSWIARAILVAAVTGVACPAAGQIYKCVDRAGRITYQQQPCPDTHTGGPVALSVDNGRTQTNDETTGDWAERAKRKEVVPGMPRAFVVVAYGAPQEMRAGRAKENAAEVWSYRRADFEVDVGFNGGVVAWKNDNPSATPVVAADNPDSPRQALGRGMLCAPLAEGLGAPTDTIEEFDEGLTRKVIRHRWDPTPTERERLVVTCADGKIERIERTPAQ
jgi:hypothetical protein